MCLNASNRSDSKAWTDPSVEEHTTNTVSNSSHTFQLYDGKMPSVLDVRDNESNRYCVFAARLKTDDFFLDSEIHLHGNSSTKGVM